MRGYHYRAGRIAVAPTRQHLLPPAPPGAHEGPFEAPTRSDPTGSNQALADDQVATGGQHATSS